MKNILLLLVLLPLSSFAATHQVGINTTTPANWLDVNGNVAIGTYAGTAAPANSLIVSGNVGIGTTSPSVPLHVYDTSGTAVELELQSSSSSGKGGFRVLNDAGTALFDIYGNNSATVNSSLLTIPNSSVIRAVQTAGLFIGDSVASGFVAFYTGGSATSNERMRIDTNGNVGIGSSSPDALLTISGTSGGKAMDFVNAGTNYQYLRFTNSGGDMGVGIEGSGTGNLQSGDLAYAGGIGTIGNTALVFGTGATTRMTIAAAGNVGIGSTSPSQLLDVAGTVKANYLLLSSDRRLKSDIQALDAAESLEKVNRLRPVSFHWKKDGSADQGLIAQDVQEILPELVSQDPQGMLSLKYTSLVAHLVGSIQELKNQNARLEKRLEALEAQTKKLNSK